MRNAGVRAAVVVLLSTLLVFAVAGLALNNLGYTGMWWDEAAQFWNSQGLSNYSPPFAKRSGVIDALRRNASENLDPGGFTVLLHFWTAFGQRIEWLRSFSLVFLIVGALGLGVLGWRLTRSILFALAACALPLLYPAALYFGLEIRAYGMEMAGVVLGSVALVRLHECPSLARAWLLGLTCAVFLTSRYSFILVALALVGAYLQGAARRVPRPLLARCLAAILLPVVVTAALAGGVMLRRQLSPGMIGGPIGISSPVYTGGSVLRGNADPVRLIARNVFSPEALPLTACALVVALLRRRAYARASGSLQGTQLERSRGLYSTLYTFILGLQAVSAIVSALGLYPWDVKTRWSAYLVTLSALAAVVIAAEARTLALARLARRNDTGALERLVRVLGGAAAALAVLAAGAGSLLHRQSVEGTYRTNVALQLERLPRGLPEHSVFVAFYEVPMVRYLYEHGPYAGRPEYPGAFRFETPAEWRSKVPIAADAEGIALIVSALPIAEARARFPGFVVLPFEPGGTRLLTVSAPAHGMVGP